MLRSDVARLLSDNAARYKSIQICLISIKILTKFRKYDFDEILV